MTTDERQIIYKAKCLGAMFIRDGKTRWMWQGGDYSYKTRLEAAYDFLEASNPAFASHPTSQDSTTAQP